MPDKTPTPTINAADVVSLNPFERCRAARADLLRLMLTAHSARTVPTASPEERALYADVATVASSLADALDALSVEAGAAAMHVTADKLEVAVRNVLAEPGAFEYLDQRIAAVVKHEMDAQLVQEMHRLLGEPSPSGKVGGQ